MTKKLSYEDIKEQANHPNITAETLNILVSATRELSAQQQHNVDHLEALLIDLEQKLGDK